MQIMGTRRTLRFLLKGKGKEGKAEGSLKKMTNEAIKNSLKDVGELKDDKSPQTTTKKQKPKPVQLKPKVISGVDLGKLLNKEQSQSRKRK